jgi:hypothetical protein
VPPALERTEVPKRADNKQIGESSSSFGANHNLTSSSGNATKLIIVLHRTDLLTIGELAARSGFAQSAPRYYENLGLITSMRP